MKTAKHPRVSGRERRAAVGSEGDAVGMAGSLPALVAGTFGKLDLAARSRLLGRLLGSVGPLALAVVGGGAFAKYFPHARWPVVPVSLEDAALATSSQVYELVRYVEQSNPGFLDAVLSALSQDGTAMTAIGASLASLAVGRYSARRGPDADRTPKAREAPAD